MEGMAIDLGALTNRHFDAIIVDNDMTLVDSDEGIRLAWVTWAQEMGIDPWSLANMTGRSTAEIVAAVVPDATTHESATTRIDSLELTHADGTKPMPGADRLLELPDDRVAVASSGTHAIIRARMAAAGLRRPTIVVGSEDVARAKPAPDIFLAAAKLLGRDPADCLVIEDSLNGLAAAKAAGCATLAVTTTHSADELSADAIITTLGDVAWELTDAGVRVIPAAEQN